MRPKLTPSHHFLFLVTRLPNDVYLFIFLNQVLTLFQEWPYWLFLTPGPFKDCYQVRRAGHSTNGMYLLKTDNSESLIQVWCEHSLDNGGWTVLQRRKDGSVNFFRNWESYKVSLFMKGSCYKEKLVNLSHSLCYRSFISDPVWAVQFRGSNQALTPID